MKQYKENFINPDTGKKEKIQVTEYFYEDYVNGIISAKFSTLGKELHRVLDTNKNIYYEYAIMSRTEYKKIQAEAKRLYEQKVNAEFDLFKTIFLKRYDTSQAKDLLLKNEIELYKKLLFNEYLPISFITDIHTPIELILPSMEMPDFSKMFTPNGFNPDYKGEKIQYYKPTKLNTKTISEIRETYKRIIIEGVKDYSHTNSPNFRIVIGGGDLHYIRVEAIHLYFEWIKNFKPDTQNPETTFRDLFICENKDEIISKIIATMRSIGIINAENKYCLGKKQKGALVGVYDCLIDKTICSATPDTNTIIFVKHFGTSITKGAISGENKDNINRTNYKLKFETAFI